MTSRAAPGSLLQIQNTLWPHPASRQVPECQNIASQAAAPVYVIFRPGGAQNVHGHIPTGMTKGSAEWIALPLTGEVDRIGNLRIAQLQTGSTPELDAEMHAT